VILHGLLQGTYSAYTFPDVGTNYELSGQGQVLPLGQTTVTGGVHSLNFIRIGRAGGTLTLSDPRGTLTLQLIGPLAYGESPLPTRYDYTITGGTGAFAHDIGWGTAFLTLTPDTTPALAGQHGRFQLNLVGGFDVEPLQPVDLGTPGPSH
jgi:hypothetical protein